MLALDCSSNEDDEYDVVGFGMFDVVRLNGAELNRRKIPRTNLSFHSSLVFGVSHGCIVIERAPLMRKVPTSTMGKEEKRGEEHET